MADSDIVETIKIAKEYMDEHCYPEAIALCKEGLRDCAKITWQIISS